MRLFAGLYAGQLRSRVGDNDRREVEEVEGWRWVQSGEEEEGG